METKEITAEDITGAIGEIRESAQQIIMSLGNIAKGVDWKSLAPKIVLGLVVLYGVRNRKLLSGIVSSMLVGMVSDKVVNAIPVRSKK